MVILLTLLVVLALSYVLYRSYRKGFDDAKDTKEDGLEPPEESST